MIPVPEVPDNPFTTPEGFPKYKDIPEEFKNIYNKWAMLQAKWFFSGLDSSKLIPKAGVDKIKALRVLGTFQGDWDLRHEHKAAGVAFLMSEWFEDYEERN